MASPSSPVVPVKGEVNDDDTTNHDSPPIMGTQHEGSHSRATVQTPPSTLSNQQYVTSIPTPDLALPAAENGESNLDNHTTQCQGSDMPAASAPASATALDAGFYAQHLHLVLDTPTLGQVHGQFGALSLPGPGTGPDLLPGGIQPDAYQTLLQSLQPPPPPTSLTSLPLSYGFPEVAETQTQTQTQTHTDLLWEPETWPASTSFAYSTDMAAPLVADASELFTDTAASILAPYHLQGATAAVPMAGSILSQDHLSFSFLFFGPGELAALSTTFNPSLVYDLYGTPGGYGAYDALWQSADFVGHAEEVCNKDKGPETMPEPARERPDEDQVVPSISLAQDEPQSVPSGAPPPTETTLGSLDSVNADPSSIVFVTASTAGPKRQRKRKAATGATGGPSKKKNTASPTPGSSSSAAELSGCPSAMQYEFVMDGASQEAKVSNSSKPMTQ